MNGVDFMYIKTQDRQNLINLNHIARVEVEANRLYTYLMVEDLYGDVWIKIGEFQNKDKTINELKSIQNWIEQPTKKVYEITTNEDCL